jgi:hypothetical protein
LTHVLTLIKRVKELQIYAHFFSLLL